MEDTKQLTDNELIAEFMGINVAHWGPVLYRSDEDGMVDITDDPQTYSPDRSWDDLMPVVEKISQHVYESYQDNNGYKDVTVHERAYPRTFGMIDNEGRWMVRINRMHLEQEDTLIKATYNAVVEWIKANQPQKAS